MASCCAFFGVVAAFASNPVELVPTPSGLRPRECVLEVPHGAEVQELNSTAILISEPATVEAAARRWVHVPPKICHELQYAPGSAPTTKTCDEPPCTCNSFPCNNWINNAGLFPKDSLGNDRAIGGFSSTYTIPGTPPPRFLGRPQVLFYFLGAENTDGLPRHGSNGVGRTILQPVLTFDPEGWCKSSSTGWCMSSWNCCPANVNTHSPYLLDLQPGEKMFAAFNMTSEGTFDIVSRDLASGKESTLKMTRDGRTFNWADVTLEVYQMSECSQFARGPMLFDKLNLWDTHYRPIVPQTTPTPAGDNAWLLTTDKIGCGGKIIPTGNPPTAFTFIYPDKESS